MEIKDLANLIRNIPDFPKPGIQFKDITTLIADGEALKLVVDDLAARYKGKKIDKVLGIEARGFLFGSALAYALGTGMLIVRKPGKLPYKSHRFTYQLEYGTDTLEIHEDAIQPGMNVLVVDDLLATGGTVSSVVNYLRNAGANVVECAFVIELDFLEGRKKLQDVGVYSIVHF